MNLSNLSIPLGFIILTDLFVINHGLSINFFLNKIIRVPSGSRIIGRQASYHGTNHVGGWQERIRMNPSSLASTHYQELEIDGLLDAETRRDQRLKRLENHLNSKKSFDIARIKGQQQQQQQLLREDYSTIIDRIDESSVKDEDFVLGSDYMNDTKQRNSILSDSPAILLQSSAGTGKTTALAGRVAHLIQSQKVHPQNMIILSFTNRDANALKEKALNILSQQQEGENDSHIDTREILEKNLWSGTLHSFAINILQKYNSNSTPLRIISTREMKNRIRQCLGRINTMSNERMIMYKNALIDAKQSIGTLVQYILRCLELWKEAGVLPSPYLNKIKFTAEGKEDSDNQPITKDDFIELAMRLGIPESSAVLAYEISGDYQVRA